MRIIVTGAEGQVARALRAAQAPGFEIIALARPDLDLTAPERVDAALRAAAPDIVVNAAAFTAVDRAESEKAEAFAVNARGAGAVARAAAALGAPVIQLSTDYVFDGAKNCPYLESDAPAPINVYGASKLAGELEVAAATPNHVILRLSWVYSAEGTNFVRTMLRLAREREEIPVVCDQTGAPCYAGAIAEAIVRISANLAVAPEAEALRGVFHFAPQGETHWAGFAEAIFVGAAARGGPRARVRPISSADYPTAAKRPANSRLDAAKLAAAHGVRAPHWRHSLDQCLDRLIGPELKTP